MNILVRLKAFKGAKMSEMIWTLGWLFGLAVVFGALSLVLMPFLILVITAASVQYMALLTLRRLTTKEEKEKLKDWG